MNQKLESVIKGGRLIALAGIASLALSCGSSPATQPAQKEPQKVEQSAKPAVAVPVDVMNPVFLPGKSLDDYFKSFNQMNSEQQIALAKTLNNLPLWDTILLARYAPIDGTLKDLSSFYSTDYKGFLELILSRSALNPTSIGGFGGISPSAEGWARNLYNNKKLAYKFPGQEIGDNISDPQTSLTLSSILFRKASEEKVADLNAVFALYSDGFKGVKPNKEGILATKDNPYVANEFGLSTAERVRLFDAIADELITFSWVSMNNLDLKKYIEDPALRKVVEANSSASYEGREAYDGVIDFLNAISMNSKKYSEDNKKMFRAETANMFLWEKILYNKEK
jgi:hypothetical protein